MKRKKRVLLVNPPFYRLMNSHFNGIPLGLCYIAAILKENEHNVRVYNADYVGDNEYSNQRNLFDSYEDYKNILNNPNHPMWKEIDEKIQGFKPDIIGITMLTGTYKSAERVAEITKKINKNIIVVVGGPHPTVLPDETIKNPFFDYVVRKEGEYTFLELVNGVDRTKIQGLTYINEDNEIVNNPDRKFISDLDTLPLPSRDLFINDTRYIDYSYIMTGRGCPYECTFCASNMIWDKKVRYHSIERVIEEIKYVQSTFGTNFFFFVDDTFILKKNRAKRICESLIKNNIKIEWVCESRIEGLDRDILKLMKKAGCVRVKIGVESGCERLLKLMKKNTKKDQIRKAVSLLKEVGIEITTHLMTGFPTETNHEVRETLEFAKELDPDYFSLSILSPYPGTAIYYDIIKNGLKLPKEHWEYFFHQSKDMMLTLDIDEKLVDEFLSLNEQKGKHRL